MPVPPRRWFQFKLSTWFLLVAIRAWAMTIRPWIILYENETLIEFAEPAYYWLNPRLQYPALALVAFVGRKAAWAIGHSIARRRSANLDPSNGD